MDIDREGKIKTLVPKVSDVVREAGAQALQFYKKDIVVETKEDASPVTNADIAVNTYLLSQLETFGWPILSEETADTNERLSSDYVWIVDPIDGTRDFIEETDEFCIMVGLAYKGSPVLGFVYAPATQTLYVGGKGVPAYRECRGEKKEILVSGVDTIAGARMVASRSHFTDTQQQFADGTGIRDMVRMGSNGLKATAVAAQSADLFFTTAAKMGEWDICAPHAIVEAAGGVVSGVRGEVLEYNKEKPHTPHGFFGD